MAKNEQSNAKKQEKRIAVSPRHQELIELIDAAAKSLGKEEGASNPCGALCAQFELHNRAQALCEELAQDAKLSSAQQRLYQEIALRLVALEVEKEVTAYHQILQQLQHKIFQNRDLIAP